MQLLPSFIQRYYYRSYSLNWWLLIEYTRSDYSSYTYTHYVHYTSTTATLYNLPTGITVTASIKVLGMFSNYYCYTYIDGASSNLVSATIMERRMLSN